MRCAVQRVEQRLFAKAVAGGDGAPAKPVQVCPAATPPLTTPPPLPCLQFGKKLQAAMTRKLAESDVTTQWSLTYKLNSKLRMQVGAKPPLRLPPLLLPLLPWLLLLFVQPAACMVCLLDVQLPQHCRSMQPLVKSVSFCSRERALTYWARGVRNAADRPKLGGMGAAGQR